ncbi:hypothetical protein T8K17_13225 [Thalassobaculum sp. OXR-137]|uniref:hypothetical protein n=1 Tax=Thalassobaculum sp. OXR-137 TaxID=3100173 RepID=UPI002AC8A26A|nr:hypothetical protein [Thalassobaculum sp. OXR-137]WPZ32203.1 hypothetical protein T8K17_13225 [Thalassobaculum sp. OXR-137]
MRPGAVPARPGPGEVSRALAILLAAVSIGLALAVWTTGDRPSALALQAERVTGPVFIAGVLLLTLIALVAAVRLHRNPGDRTWRALGLQAASGIATLALTFTLLGIGLGISSLSSAPIGPDTVAGVIATLTGRFALAFATTVVGLPLAASLRAVLLVLASRRPGAQERGDTP